MKNNTSTQKTWNLRVRRPSPSMNQDRIVFGATSYADAVEYAQRVWRGVRRSVVLGSGELSTYWYHRIDGDGIATDRNTGSGIPENEALGVAA